MVNNMKDFFQQPLNVGDRVVIMKPKYRDLTPATIVSMGRKKATLKYMHQGREETTTQFYNQIIKHIEQMDERAKYLVIINTQKGYDFWLQESLVPDEITALRQMHTDIIRMQDGSYLDSGGGWNSTEVRHHDE